ncbi:MAG TPA: type III pantothenate kinase [Bacteroidia bacterium]|nr:type III pantothenate kinase [Bacteroidia bacterium]
MYHLIIDIGNTCIKGAWYRQSKLSKIVSSSYSKNELKSLAVQLQSKPIQSTIVCSVKKEIPTEVLNCLNKMSNVIRLTHETPVPIKNLYKSPETLGLDRLANAVGLTCYKLDIPMLSIDVGTCIKYDLVIPKNKYVGGSISPGIKMRFKALNEFTAQLPLVESKGKVFKITGRNTTESIISGVLNGTLGEIESMIKTYEKQYPDIRIVLTGGDHRIFADKLKKSIFVAPNLTLNGLNEILFFNQKNLEKK